jgi:hypothetical protein
MELDNRGHSDKHTVFETLIKEFGIPVPAEELRSSS